MGDEITLYGSLASAGNGQVISLSSDAFLGTVNYIVVPKGFKCVIKSVTIAGAEATMYIEVSKDEGTNWTKVQAFDLASPGTLNIDEVDKEVVAEMPLITQIRFTSDKPTADPTNYSITIEFVKMKEGKVRKYGEKVGNRR